MTFESWLGQRYQPSTVRKTLAAIRGAREHGLDAYEGDPSLRRYTGYLLDAGASDDFDQAVLELELEPPRARRPPDQRGRKLPARSIGDEDWRRLCQALTEDHTAEGCVLTVACQWPRRIGEVLSLTRAQIERGLERGQIRLTQKGGTELVAPVGGAESALGKLVHVMELNHARGAVAAFVCPEGSGSALAGDGAYQRCNRYLKHLAGDLQLEGRIHVHRLRRTVAVQALRLTADVNLVRDLLGHRSVQSTFRYVDEVRLGDVGALQQRLGDFR